MLDRIFPSPINSLLVSLVLAAGAGLAAGIAGYQIGHDKAADKGRAELSDLKRDHATALTAALAEAHQRYVGEVEYGLRLAKQLVGERETHATEKRELLERIKGVTTVYLPAGAVAPVALPYCVFTAGFVREYNTALGLPAVAAGAPASGVTAAPSAAAALGSGLRDSGVSQADILSHIADYGQRCRGLESQLGRALDYLDGRR